MEELNEEQLVSLITKHLAGELSEEEVSILQLWVETDPANSRLLDRVSNEKELSIEIDKWRQINPSKGYSKWLRTRKVRRKSRVIRIATRAVAAALLIAVGGIWMLGKTPWNKRSSLMQATVVRPVLAGRNTAVLTLDNGRQILLDSAGNGHLGMQGQTQIVKMDSGRLAYTAFAGRGNEEIVYNTLSTPRSGQYQLVLPDGSRVWLNNVSSLRYPVAFTGKTRTVELTGEAYFEIKTNPSQPFVVKVNGEDVEVLGTSFNIMAYLDEAYTQTTLLTGAVQVKTSNKVARLRPDEQAQVGKAGDLTLKKDVASEDVVSWKNGFFYFDRATLTEVMRQLARWYDVDVEYEGKAPDLEFGGKIDRSLPLDELLKFLDKNQIHFRLEGRKIIVKPS